MRLGLRTAGTIEPVAADDLSLWTAICPRPLIVRAESQLTSDQVGELCPGTQVRVVEMVHTPNGTLRVRVRRVSDLRIIGWVTHYNESGILNLMKGVHLEPVGQRWQACTPSQRGERADARARLKLARRKKSAQKAPTWHSTPMII